MRNNLDLKNITNVKKYEGELICWKNVLEDLDIIIISKFKMLVLQCNARHTIIPRIDGIPSLDGVNKMSIVSIPSNLGCVRGAS